MDWREFIASLVDSLAWPAAAVALVALVRSRLEDLLSLRSGPLRRLKVGPGGAELEWQEVAAEVKASSVRAHAALPTSPLDDDAEPLTHLDALAERNPAEAIRQASGIVMGELRRIVEARGVELLVPGSKDPNILVKSAYRGGAITKESGEALRGLLTLRALAERDPENVPVEKAVDYILLAQAVLYALGRP